MRSIIDSLDKFIREQSARLIAESYRLEIEKAIDNAKRSKEDKTFRQQWYKAAAQRRRRDQGVLLGRE